MAGNGVITFTPPVLTDFSWVNQGTATATQNGDTAYLFTPAESGTQLRCLVKSLPSAPFTITTFISCFVPRYNYTGCGLCIRNNSNGKIATLQMASESSGTIRVMNWASATQYTSLSTAVNTPLYSCLGMRLSITSGSPGTRTWEVSMDGLNWITVVSHANNTHVEPDQVGFFVNAQNTSGPVAITMLHWLEE